eukprot:CAMPEP_0197076372 /NCGR_PEP_ID=MMETSP1384-20130603/212082_1 /TAXON_ID=29189 /ORGANISM="Ammonia sp." /LENGTH=374 /DNA_ID=CAMNT_0042515225 /DNA_START=111 /DNA_END=1235 /DNA_ORIENTATION=-
MSVETTTTTSTSSSSTSTTTQSSNSDPVWMILAIVGCVIGLICICVSCGILYKCHSLVKLKRSVKPRSVTKDGNIGSDVEPALPSNSSLGQGGISVVGNLHITANEKDNEKHKQSAATANNSSHYQVPSDSHSFMLPANTFSSNNQAVSQQESPSAVSNYSPFDSPTETARPTPGGTLDAMDEHQLNAGAFAIDSELEYAMVRSWLESEVHIPQYCLTQYFELFIVNGYDSLEKIFTIDSREVLRDKIGIQIFGHRVKLLADIQRGNATERIQRLRTQTIASSKRKLNVALEVEEDGQKTGTKGTEDRVDEQMKRMQDSELQSVNDNDDELHFAEDAKSKQLSVVGHVVVTAKDEVLRAEHDEQQSVDVATQFI